MVLVSIWVGGRLFSLSASINTGLLMGKISLSSHLLTNTIIIKIDGRVYQLLPYGFMELSVVIYLIFISTNKIMGIIRRRL